MDLTQKMREALSNAQAAVAAGDLEKAREYRKSADDIKSLMEEQKALDSLGSFVVEPVRPTLPGTQVAESASTVKAGEVRRGWGEQVVEAAPKAEDTTERVPVTLKAAYITRFGDEDAMVKGILTDLHGANHQQDYWLQKLAFRRYLRGGEPALDSADRKALRQVILNPTYVKGLLNDGWDDLNTVKATMVEAADSMIGNLVPVDFQMRIIERMKGMTVMRGRATTSTTSRDRVERPEFTGANTQYTNGMRGKWVDETPTAGTAATDFTTGMQGINIHTYMAEVFLSRNAVEDSAFNVESHLERKFAEMSAIDEDNVFLTGNGVGKPQGILPGSTNGLSLTEKVSGSGSALTWDGLIGMTYGLQAQYRQSGAVWIANKATYESIAKLKDSNFGYMWQAYQFRGGEDGEVGPPPLLGYKTLEQETMPDIASNAYPIIFGNPGGYEIIDRLGMTVERYIDSNTARINQVCYVLRRRLGGKVVESWQFVVQKVST